MKGEWIAYYHRSRVWIAFEGLGMKGEWIAYYRRSRVWIAFEGLGMKGEWIAYDRVWEFGNVPESTFFGKSR